MTPDEHAARAEALLKIAERMHEEHVRAGSELPTGVQGQIQMYATMAQAHATLAMRPTRAWAPLPANEVVDYGDGFPN